MLAEVLPENPNTGILELFDTTEHPEDIHPVLSDIRKRAYERFLELGIPGKKNERYKYTDIGKILEKEYLALLHPSHRNFKIDEIFRCDIPSMRTYMFVVLNGFFFEEQDKLVELPGGILAGGLQQALKEVPQLVKPYLDKNSAESTDGMVALNRSFATDGFFMFVPDNTVLEKPVQVVNLVKDDRDIMVQHRNLIVMGQNTRVNMVVCDHTLSENNFLSNALTEIYLQQDSSLDLTKLQNEHNRMSDISHIFIVQEKNSQVRSNFISLHGGMIRNNLNISLDGENAENHAYGLFLMDRKQHVDNSVFVDHASPNCFSNQLYKGVLDEEATGAFEGKILVRPHAQKTKAYQVNKNILLADTARMNTKPQLEIYADDVKCTHGATVGRLDEEAMFYLRSRGIPGDEARLLLMYAFANEVIREIIIEPLRDRIRELVDKRLRGELPRCHTCLVDYER